jgi:hypothetical protein
MKRRKEPRLSAKKLVKVQPMTAPVDIVFSMKFVWGTYGGRVWRLRLAKYYYWEMFREKNGT